MGPMSDESMPTLIEKPLAEILTFWAPGSAAWPWSDEYSVLVDDPVTERIRQRVRSEGIGFADATAPVLLGSDGRVWDGHHRIVIAIQEGMHSLMCEIVGAADRAWPSSPTLTRELSTAEGKARAELANALWMRTGQGGVSDVVIDALSEIVLELGWRPPARVIETVAERDALPKGTVLARIYPDGSGPSCYVNERNAGWVVATEQIDAPRVSPFDQVGNDLGPLIVLREPGENS
jgi:hypothetical protein